MENIPDKSIFDFSIDEEGKSSLAAIAKWVNINAIVAFISLGISIISTVSTVSNLNRYSSNFGGGAVIFTFIIELAISLLLNITLLAVASNLKKAVDMTDQNFLGIGLAKLATYFKILGILIIIVLIIVVLFLLIILASGGRGY